VCADSLHACRKEEDEINREGTLMTHAILVVVGIVMGNTASKNRGKLQIAADDNGVVCGRYQCTGGGDRQQHYHSR
jgi:hypothetical protein